MLKIVKRCVLVVVFAATVVLGSAGIVQAYYCDCCGEYVKVIPIGSQPLECDED